jgi:hypothetical protein
MTLEKCPGREQLREVLAGVQPAGNSVEIEQHLLTCERCSKQAETLFPAEDITALLAHGSQTPAMPDEAAVVEQLIDQAKRWHAVAQSALPDQTMLEGTAGDLDVAVENRAPALDLSFLQPALAADELGRLGGYRVLQVLGSGGMGIVFRAEDPRLKRQVALKAMKPGIAAQHTAARRFLREAEAIAALEHDHIVTIYQVGEDAGIPFIAMQLLRGESLQQRLDRGDQLDLQEVVRIGSEIASGLQAAHARGLIHRDIKPDNIWLQEGTGRVRILDFGLVQNDGEDLHLTGSGIVLGTPRYMAPEQARGLPVDHRCDLFSLGSVLYRMLAGRTPFEGSNLTATLIAVAHEQPRPLQEIAPHASPELAAFVMQLLSKDPAQRLQTATEVFTRLQQLAVPAVHPTSAPVSGNALTARTSVDPQGTTAVAGGRRAVTPPPHPVPQLPRQAFEDPEHFARPLSQTLDVHQRRREDCPWVAQQTAADCGLAALVMAANLSEIPLTFVQLRAAREVPPQGLSLLQLRELACQFGLEATALRVDREHWQELTLPTIAHLQDGNYVVIFGHNYHSVLIGDPATGVLRMAASEFCQRWSGYCLHIAASGGMKR